MPSVEERQARRHARWREAILQAAAEEFAEHGYWQATLSQIGDRVGLSKASLYHYVSSKEELLADMLEQVTAQIAAATSEAGATNAVGSLRAFVQAHAMAGTTNPLASVLGENLDALMDRAATRRLAELRARHEASLIAILEHGIESGEFDDVEVVPTAKLVFGALNSIPRWYDPQGSLTVAELVEHVTTLILDGLRSRTGTVQFDDRSDRV